MMIFPATTAFFAAIFAILFIGISAWIVAGRVQTNVMRGDGGLETLGHRIQVQNNFAEYVPFALLLIALLEGRGASHGSIVALCVVLLVARLLHPFGIFAAPGTPPFFVCRGGGTVGTFGVTLVAAIMLLA